MYPDRLRDRRRKNRVKVNILLYRPEEAVIASRSLRFPEFLKNRHKKGSILLPL
jgi:hypothetical protein